MSNVANMFRNVAISASVAFCVISRAAMLSSAAQTVIISRISFFDLRTTKAPRRGYTLTNPSCSNRVMASRMGVRLTPNSSESCRSSSRVSSGLGIDVHRGDGLLQRIVNLVLQDKIHLDGLDHQFRCRHLFILNMGAATPPQGAFEEAVTYNLSHLVSSIPDAIPAQGPYRGFERDRVKCIETPLHSCAVRSVQGSLHYRRPLNAWSNIEYQIMYTSIDNDIHRCVSWLKAGTQISRFAPCGILRVGIVFEPDHGSHHRYVRRQQGG